MPETDAERSQASATSELTQDPPREQLDALFALYNQGKLHVVLQQAEALVKSFPRSFTVWQLLGAVNVAATRLNQAGNAFTQACNLKPSDAVAHSNLGTVLQAQGKFDLAIAAYERALKINADFAGAQYNLGTALRAQGKLDQAITAFRRTIAIKSDHAAAHNSLGNALCDQGELDEAVAAYNRAIAVKADHAAAYTNLGIALRAKGKPDEAIAAHRRAIAVKPDYAEAYSNLGNVLREQRRLDEAIAAHQRAIAINPNHAGAHTNLGVALYDQGKLNEAIAAYQRAIIINPHYADAHSNLGDALTEQGKLNEAIDACQRAIAINPNHANAHYNLGVALQDQGKLNEAIDAYQRAINSEPDHADAYWNTSLGMLALADFHNGWRKHEWRWRRTHAEKPRQSGKPLWLGDLPLASRTILLWGEQGLGDQIQFVRYATSVSELGARVILEVSDQLVRLLGDLKGVSKIVGASTPVPDSEFDFHCPLMSLPLALGTELSTIPDVPSLTTHMKDVSQWAERVPSGMPKIGIAWSGNPKHKNDRNRSVALSQLAPILTPHAAWISLQKEVSSADRPTLDALAGAYHFGSDLSDLLDTAALCEQCDLVISVDTSIAHLAATLGRPVWLLLPFAPDWRWLQDREDSPWYPTMKLYRQQKIGDWESVFQRVGVDLQAWLTQR